MKILGIDVETTGLDRENDEIIELGAVLWDWEKQKPIWMINHLMKPEGELREEITKITGIEKEDFKYSMDPKVVEAQLHIMMLDCDYIMAHNAPFDRAFVERIFSYPDLKEWAPKPWLDTKADIEYDEIKHKHNNLVTLAATHGFLNPFAHRAVFDVLTMLMVAKNYDIKEMANRAASPAIRAVASVTFGQKDLAKEAGFMWEPKKKYWFKDLKMCDQEKLDALPFSTIVTGVEK